MKIALIAIHPHPSPQAVPLACAYLQEALLADQTLKGSLQTTIAEFFLHDDAATCARGIAVNAPDLVAFSVYVWSRDHAVAVARELRSLLPGAVLCAGGAEPTANPAGLLNEGVFDFLVRGEGEGALVQAVRLLSAGGTPAGVPGIVLPGEPAATLPPPLDLDSVPSPYLSGRLDPTIPGGALWQLSRGCDFACSFCFDHKGSGGVRRFSMERIEAELRLFARLQVPQIFVLDSTFNKDPKRAKEILRLIRKTAPGIHFHFEVRSEFIDAEMAELFASITCSLQIGLQSADAAVLRAVGRGFDREDFVNRAFLLNQSGAIFGFDLIYGLPGDTPELFRSSLDFALSLYPNHLDIFPLAVLPGTRLYGKAQTLGLRHLADPPYTVYATAGYTLEQLDQTGRLAAACDVFYSRGKAVAWFNSVVAPLKLTPSAFLSAFAAFLGERGEADIAEEEIWGLQRSFLERIFKQRKKAKLLPLALDLADYHHHYAAALMATPPEPPSPKQLSLLDPLKQPLVLAASTTLARFSYEVLEILDAGEPDLAEFSACFNATGSCALIYPAHGEVCTESVSPPYFELLQALDGKQTAQALCRRIRLSVDEAREFLEFALAEGIVQLASARQV
ncbi:radical SAM protein [Geomonas sp. Red69]|uniref:B12-binding domain-containing radical SAM protein n=1 Tax=Geomonas diazotrophica TaxID=2843197 RepID=UPI001C10D3A3|nr:MULTISPECIES: radical SAM protein [Geomonas]MBU5635351.1 radical SAM protein [Geomonas diazotrophica]QXE86734.1 radical SAM protein [Geomonas nitrogeniifigens]